VILPAQALSASPSSDWVAPRDCESLNSCEVEPEAEVLQRSNGPRLAVPWSRLEPLWGGLTARVASPRESPLYRLVEQRLEELLRVWPARFLRQHGPLRPVVERVLREFLKCGLVEHAGGMGRRAADAAVPRTTLDRPPPPREILRVAEQGRVGECRPAGTEARPPASPLFGPSRGTTLPATAVLSPLGLLSHATPLRHLRRTGSNRLPRPPSWATEAIILA
jgi:hypothetical protein